MGTAALGGTFDGIHRGHLALIGRALEISDGIIIGLASDVLAKRRGKAPTMPYEERLEGLRRAVDSEFPGATYEIARLDDIFGPAVLDGRVDALVVSEETAGAGDDLNRLRATRGVRPVRVVVVPMVAAEDGSPISSTRIRAREVDAEGRLTGGGANVEPGA
ncbi:Phosphopantetheine adenylyltransferase [Nitrosopumilaceae archaeon]|nr:pantetheine-phosphate adenylyltransferase [Nitrosopumilus sp.]CAI9831597.1 Phosphopantetheine adenylyltransferase [Nitrosopumilaceae archaeon]MDA7941563.1 pantetheine-phosphate adenylyltransferase [Nitrosopumilus sp.]MDA7943584.1 pantetheine-phosphate adenylyltransferase [Nitrosopumilus sp.]MDA7945046.1 pantetheine-phosphate adenylyltransferase [Nitrosopumilus sp.]